MWPISLSFLFYYSHSFSLVYALGYQKIYNTLNPFDWMELISLQGKTNFFERRVAEYQKSGVAMNTKADGDDNIFCTDADF